MTVSARPFLTTCDLCHARMAAVPGPASRTGRPMPPDGFELGYIVEGRDRQYPICVVCLDRTIAQGERP